MGNNQRQYISQLCLYVFFTIVSLQYAFLNTEFEFTGMVSTFCAGLAITAFIACFVMRQYSLPTFIKIVALLAISLINYATTHETVFTIEILAAILFSLVDAKHLFQYIFYERVILLLLIVICSVVGILPFNAVEVFKGGMNSKIVLGYAFGFNHPNQFASAICFLILIYICYKNDQINVKNIFCIAVIMLCSYFFSKSRTLLVTTTFILLMVIMLQYRSTSNIFKRLLKILAPWSLPTFVVASIVFPLSMTTATGRLKTYLWAFNDLIGSRFSHSARVFSTYKIPLFGGINHFDELQRLYGYSVVDSGYINLLFDFGILGFVIFIVLYILTIRRLIREQEYIYLAVLIAVFMWGFTENIFRSFGMNFTVLFWGMLLNHDDRQGKQKHRRRIQITL